MKTISLLTAVLCATGCSSVVVPRQFETQRTHYTRGIEEAKSDQRNGIQRIAAIECYEEEDWQTLWVMRRLLKQRYNIEYNVISPSPIPAYVAFVEGYNSIALPSLRKTLNENWYQRLWVEAESFKKQNWEKLKDDYEKERGFGS